MGAKGFFWQGLEDKTQNKGHRRKGDKEWTELFPNPKRGEKKKILKRDAKGKKERERGRGRGGGGGGDRGGEKNNLSLLQNRSRHSKFIGKSWVYYRFKKKVCMRRRGFCLTLERAKQTGCHLLAALTMIGGDILI